MGSRRTARVAQAIKEEVSTTILFGLRDPRIKNVTVLNVEVTGDLRSAKVYVSVMGDAKEQALTMHGLESARGYLQSKVADRIQTRYTPILTFVLDQGVKKSIEASRILRETLGAEHPPEPESETDDDTDEEWESEDGSDDDSPATPDDHS